MRFSVWAFVLLLPLWIFVCDSLVEQFIGIQISGRWLYVSVLMAAVFGAVVIAASRLPVWKRILLVLGSWLLLVGEVVALGVFELARHGFEGIH